MQELQSPERTPFSEITLEMEADKETEIWYAMRATYRREPDAMRLLEKEKMGWDQRKNLRVFFFKHTTSSVYIKRMPYLLPL